MHLFIFFYTIFLLSYSLNIFDFDGGCRCHLVSHVARPLSAQKLKGSELSLFFVFVARNTIER